MLKSTRPPRCRHCRERTDSVGRLLHDDCIPGWLDAQAKKKAIAEEKKRKAEAKVDKARRAKLDDTPSNRKALAQAAVNEFVRMRDAHLPCISCGCTHSPAWHAGHYRSRGSAPHLALDPRNLNRQCAQCNLHLHGNLIEYRKGLVERYGISHVEALESDQESRGYKAADYDAIAAHYRAEVRRMKKEMG